MYTVELILPDVIPTCLGIEIADVGDGVVYDKANLTYRVKLDGNGKAFIKSGEMFQHFHVTTAKTLSGKSVEVAEFNTPDSAVAIRELGCSVISEANIQRTVFTFAYGTKAMGFKCEF